MGHTDTLCATATPEAGSGAPLTPEAFAAGSLRTVVDALPDAVFVVSGRASWSR